MGWIQEWEPGYRRAYYVEESTGRTQWEMPYSTPPYGDRGPPGPPGGYYGQPPYGPPGGYAPPEGPPPQKRDHGDASKLIGAGVAGLALGAAGGALWEHEHGMSG